MLTLNASGMLTLNLFAPVAPCQAPPPALVDLDRVHVLGAAGYGL